MARPRKDGLKVTRKRQADGTIKEYYYDRATNTFLANDRAAAVRRQAVLCPKILPESTELPEGTFGWLIERYKKNSRYTDCAPGTKRLYDGYLKHMMEEYGDLPIRSIKPKMISAIRDKLSATPAKANQTLALFRILLSYAERELEAIPSNPAARPGRLTPPKREQVWSDEDIDVFLKVAPVNMRLAMSLMFLTAQRLSDMLAMTTSQVSEAGGRLYIDLRQQKTDQWVSVPVHSRLEPLLRARLATPIVRQRVAADGRKIAELVPLLVPSPEGHIWNRRNFSRAWDVAMRRMNFRIAKGLFRAGMTKAEVKEELIGRHRQRRDLRRTAMVRMAEAGATTPQIAGVSGHSIDSCQKILDVYLPRRADIALGAIRAWEKQEESARSVLTTVLTTDNFKASAS
jgi:integrase